MPMSVAHKGAARGRPIFTLRALSADASFLRTLESNHFRGRVHSVFERVVNVEGAGVQLFTLACRDLDNGPNTIVIDGSGFGTTGIAADDPVAVAEGTLMVGHFTVIVLTGAAGWNCALPAYSGDDARLRANLRCVESHLEQYGEGGGMVASPGEESPFVDTVTAALRLRARMLMLALSRANIESACAHAKSMIGLGPGLTPSGDDFLVGLFAVLNVPGSPCNSLRSACSDILAGAGRWTNAISLTALTQAANGCVRESIAALMTSLMYGPRDRLLASLDRVLAIGSTSGTDLVAGIVSGFQLNLQASRPCH
jgi:hypothetical protein